MNRHLYPPVSIDVFKNSDEIGRAAAAHIIDLVKTVRDAVIILPTGDTPRPMYKELVKKFETDRTLDLSGVVFFNLDEYMDLPQDHPLSYSYYMKKLFYDNLDRIDASRAPRPENRHIPFVKASQKPASAVKSYNSNLKKAVKKTGRGKADLAVLGIGGAYPVKDSKGRYAGIKGGHIGFNEPGSKITDSARVVTLTKKTRLDTAFRFLNLHYCENIYGKKLPFYVPSKALTLGIADILNSREILLLANMEEKMPVIKHLYERAPSPDLPATFLKYHGNVRWLLDRDAASELPQVKTPWKNCENLKWNKELVRQAVIEMLSNNPRRGIKDADQELLEKAGLPYSETVIAGGPKGIQKEISEFLKYSLNGEHKDLLPSNSRILVFSPHPDDDSITMAATIKKLKDNRNDIWVVYMVSGENAVRNDSRSVREKLKSLTARSGEKSLSKDRREEYLRLSRIEVRQDEARKAAKIMGLYENRLFFLNLPYYYHRGLIDIDPIDSIKDVDPVRKIILSIRPQHVFYSAEADPHGAHGLCARIISMAFEKLPQFWNESFWGYRGAYEEWPLHRPEGLVIVPFDKRHMGLKIKCIKAHASQLDPVFPSFDHREFWERARDRNRATGRLLEQMGYLKGGPHFAEVFRRISYAEFIRTR